MVRTHRSSLLIAWLVACAPPAATEPVRREPVAAAPDAASVVSPLSTRRLQRWMESELLYRIRTRDFRGLVRSLDALATVPPPGYPNWTAIAERAAQAASESDVEAVRRGCAMCHQQYRARYRAASIEFDIDQLIERSRR